MRRARALSITINTQHAISPLDSLQKKRRAMSGSGMRQAEGKTHCTIRRGRKEKKWR